MDNVSQLIILVLRQFVRWELYAIYDLVFFKYNYFTHLCKIHIKEKCSLYTHIPQSYTFYTHRTDSFT